MPRAKRSQTTPPSSTTSSIKSHTKKSEKSKSIDESSSSTHSEESNDIDQSSTSATTTQNQFLDCTVINSIHSQSSSISCDLLNQNCSELSSIVASQDITKDQKNHNNFCTMSSQQIEKEFIISNGADSNKIDKDEKELMRASQEINRSNRKLIKQTFNSNVLEIESASGVNAEKAVNNDDDDWDTL